MFARPDLKTVIEYGTYHTDRRVFHRRYELVMKLREVGGGRAAIFSYIAEFSKFTYLICMCETIRRKALGENSRNHKCRNASQK